jgi:hypothetical protein
MFFYVVKALDKRLELKTTIVARPRLTSALARHVQQSCDLPTFTTLGLFESSCDARPCIKLPCTGDRTANVMLSGMLTQAHMHSA